MRESAEAYRAWLETLTRETLARIHEHVVGDVHFRDPFNDVTGAAAMHRVFAHMFDVVEDVRFEIPHLLSDGPLCLMSWTFTGRLRGSDWTFDGCSLVRFGSDGRVVEHIDQWDAARNFYERLPVLGYLISRIRKRIADAAPRPPG